MKNLFHKYSHNQNAIDGQTFAKLCKDNKLLSEKVTIKDVDIVFRKIKEKGSHKLNFGQFRQAVAELADIEGVDADE